MTPRVELVSNIGHYYYTALALERIGYLGHYITGPSALESEGWFARLGGPFARAWRERRLSGLPPEKVKRIWFAEIVQKAVRKCGGSGTQANRLHNELFGRTASARLSECDAVHFVHSVGLESARKAKKRGAKVICDMREEHPEFQDEILNEEAKRFRMEFSPPGIGYKRRVLEELQLADVIFTPSTYAKRTFVARGLDADRIVVCPYGVDTSMFSPAPARLREKFTVLFLGRLCVRKGTHYLLEAFAKAALPDARLVLAGPVDEAFRPLLHKYDGLFEASGPVARADLHRYYSDADVFVIPSLADAYPLVTMEAMASGLPVIVSENTGTSEIVREGENGFVVPIRNAQAIVQKLAWLHEHRDKCAAMGLIACEAAKEQTWENYISTCGHFYNQFFNRKTVRSEVH